MSNVNNSSSPANSPINHLEVPQNKFKKAFNRGVSVIADAVSKPSSLSKLSNVTLKTIKFVHKVFGEDEFPVLDLVKKPVKTVKNIISVGKVIDKTHELGKINSETSGLSIAHKVTSLATSILKTIKFFGTLRLMDLERFAASIGKIPVFGIVSKLPLGVVLNILKFVVNVLGAVEDVLKIFSYGKYIRLNNTSHHKWSQRKNEIEDILSYVKDEIPLDKKGEESSEDLSGSDWARKSKEIRNSQNEENSEEKTSSQVENNLVAKKVDAEKQTPEMKRKPFSKTSSEKPPLNIDNQVTVGMVRNLEYDIDPSAMQQFEKRSMPNVSPQMEKLLNPGPGQSKVSRDIFVVKPGNKNLGSNLKTFDTLQQEMETPQPEEKNDNFVENSEQQVDERIDLEELRQKEMQLERQHKEKNGPAHENEKAPDTPILPVVVEQTTPLTPYPFEDVQPILEVDKLLQLIPNQEDQVEPIQEIPFNPANKGSVGIKNAKFNLKDINIKRNKLCDYYRLKMEKINQQMVALDAIADKEQLKKLDAKVIKWREIISSLEGNNVEILSKVCQHMELKTFDKTSSGEILKQAKIQSIFSITYRVAKIIIAASAIFLFFTGIGSTIAVAAVILLNIVTYSFGVFKFFWQETHKLGKKEFAKIQNYKEKLIEKSQTKPIQKFKELPLGYHHKSNYS